MKKITTSDVPNRRQGQTLHWNKQSEEDKNVADNPVTEDKNPTSVILLLINYGEHTYNLIVIIIIVISLIKL
jgi:hypothetical protein